MGSETSFIAQVLSDLSKLQQEINRLNPIESSDQRLYQKELKKWL